MTRRGGIHRALTALVSALVLVGGGAAAGATEIVEVRSDKGITAWLKQEPSIPMIAVNALWVGSGAVSDPAGREGVANLLSGMLLEGAADMDSQAFRRALDDHAVRLGFESGWDHFYLSLQTLTEEAGEAFRLTGLALTAPRMDQAPLSRLRDEVLDGLSRDTLNPRAIAGKAFSARIFGDDRYGKPQDGMVDSVTAITVGDLRRHVRERLARDNLIIGVVGDIDPEALKPLLDSAFAALPAMVAQKAIATGAASVPVTPSAKGGLEVIDHAGPQTTHVFGLPGLKRDDPDFDAARLMNHMLGGGGFASRLTVEIREKRGLTYSIYSTLWPLARAGLWRGGLATSNDKSAEALTVLKTTINRFVETGPSPEELAKTKANINGAFPLRFTSNRAIARLLSAMQLHDLGRDYMQRRPERINAVSVQDIRRVARRLLVPERLTIIAVGRPKGLSGALTE